MSHVKTSEAKRATLKALRIDRKNLTGIGALLLVTLFAFSIAEWSTGFFSGKIDTELRALTSSDISVSSQAFPSSENRSRLREIGNKHGSRMSESVEFPFTVDMTDPYGSGRFLAVNVRIVDPAYPLYGSIAYSGSLSGALAEGEVSKYLSGFSISGRSVPVTGVLMKAPGVSENPFALNRDVLVPVSVLPFESVTSSGSGYRTLYRMDYAVVPDKEKALLEELRSFASGAFRVREEGSEGSFSDIATTMNDFLWSVLYASALIALSSFVVLFSRFALERKKIVRTLTWLGYSESKLLRMVFWRFLSFFLLIGVPWLIVFARLPGISGRVVLKWAVFLLSAMVLWYLLLSENLLPDLKLMTRIRTRLRILFGVSIMGLLASYVFLSGESLRPLAYALFAIVLLERFSAGFFRLATVLFQAPGTGKSRFFLLDALRSFRSAPALAKVSFSVFFLLAATLASVFLFSLAFRDTLRTTTESSIDTFVINLLPSDYEKLSTWIPKNEFYSTLRARILSVNGKSLPEHLGTRDIPGDISREFNITDTKTDSMIVRGKPAVAPREVTIDEDFSKRLDVNVGDIVGFSLAGREFGFQVVGVRESKRSGTTPFFYFQIPENAIPGAPKTYFLATKAGANADLWKKRVLADSGPHISFIDAGAILSQIRSYSELALQGVIALFSYIAAIGLLAFLTAERSFFLQKIRKVQLYRVLGCTERDAFRLLFIESVLGNMAPMIMGSIIGAIALIVFLRDNPILKISPGIMAVALAVLAAFFLVASLYARHSVRAQIRKTEPRIGATE